MERIKKTHLEHQLKEINQLLGTPLEAWATVRRAGELPERLSNPGHVFLSGSSSGYTLVQITNQRGGEKRLINYYGHNTREAYVALLAFRAALEVTRPTPIIIHIEDGMATIDKTTLPSGVTVEFVDWDYLRDAPRYTWDNLSDVGKDRVLIEKPNFLVDLEKEEKEG